MIITVDGTSASGKGTLAKHIAKQFNLPHLDTGLLYRAVALRMYRLGIPYSSQESAANISLNIQADELSNEGLKRTVISQGASIVSAYPEVRKNLLKLQIAFANQPGGAVLDGRDCGSVIAPHADHKFYLDADVKIRATRRYSELKNYGEQIDLDDVIKDLSTRDDRDANRKTAPLKIPQNATIIDTTHLGVTEVLNQAINIVSNRKLQRNTINPEDFVKNLIAVDIEGDGQKNQSPIEIGVCEIFSKKPPSSWLIKPPGEISPYATKIHGMSKEDFVNAPTANEIEDKIIEALSDRIVVGHGIRQDIETIRNVMPKLQDLIVLDTLKMSKNLYPGLPTYRLSELAEHLGITKPEDNLEIHRAYVDATLNARLFEKLCEHNNAREYLKSANVMKKIRNNQAHVTYPIHR